MKEKYKDQDEEDRELMQQILRVGRLDNLIDFWCIIGRKPIKELFSFEFIGCYPNWSSLALKVVIRLEKSN